MFQLHTKSHRNLWIVYFKILTQDVKVKYTTLKVIWLRSSCNHCENEEFQYSAVQIFFFYKKNLDYSIMNNKTLILWCNNLFIANGLHFSKMEDQIEHFSYNSAIAGLFTLCNLMRQKSDGQIILMSTHCSQRISEAT